MWELIGFTASILSAATFVPEVIQAFKTKHLDDIAWGMLSLLVMNNMLWVAYAIYFNIVPVILSSSLNFIMGLLLVSIKWRAAHTVQLIEVRDPVKIEIVER